jgi:hypothetical protein
MEEREEGRKGRETRHAIRVATFKFNNASIESRD